VSCKILVVGKSSFIAQALSRLPDRVSLVSRDELALPLIRRHDVIVNCSIAPEYHAKAYDEGTDVDLRIARLAAKAGAHFVLLSTRRVYGQHLHRQPLTESSPLQAADFYGINKAETERRVSLLLGTHCTILRLSNVFGYELGRRSFFGLALGRLRSEGRIILDVSPFAVRDFIPVEGAAQIIAKICSIKPPGTYNLGSATGLQIGRVAEWLVAGYGRGELLVTDLGERDSFVLDVGRLSSVLGHVPGPYDFNSIIRNIGKQLSHE
jgi:dTDP-4-dehydrorhamnose reductase/UDP-glucose 4-epimerase